MIENPYAPPKSDGMLADERIAPRESRSRLHRVYASTFDISGFAFLATIVVPLLVLIAGVDIHVAAALLVASLMVATVVCVMGMVLGIFLWCTTGRAFPGVFRHLVVLLLCIGAGIVTLLF